MTVVGRFLVPVLLLWLACLPASLAAERAGSEQGHGQGIDIELFTREGCPRCTAAKAFLAELQRERRDLRIEVRDVGADAASWARLKALAAERGVRALGVPAFFLRGELLIGFAGAETTGRRIRSLLAAAASGPGQEGPEGACRAETTIACDQPTAAPGSPAAGLDGVDVPFLGRLTVQELGLPLFTFALGLLDGFNPCSMWVLVFILSLLAGLRDRVKLMVLAGTFVAVQGVIYFAFMAAWLNAFLLVGLSRVTEVILGGIAMLAGTVNVKEFVAFGRNVSLGIPQAAKPGLYAKLRGILQAEHLAGALAGIVVLAVFVQVVELLCTAGFPALYTRILTMRQLEWWGYYGYLALYNVAYMLDDVIVLAVGVITLSQRRLQEREGRWLKLVSGAVMLGLGVLLIAKPEWLGE